MHILRNPELAGIRKSLRLVMVLAAIAWAAQHVVGEEPAVDSLPRIAPVATDEKFVPGSQRFLQGATLELRAEASVASGEVTIKQICRWSDADKAAFEPIADLIVVRMGAGARFRTVTAKELKSLLHDAGVNLAVIRFAGQTRCSITRTDVATGEQASIDDFIKARQAATRPAPVFPPHTDAPAVVQRPPVPRLAAASQPGAPAAEDSKTLRERLVADISERLSIDPQTLQMRFNPEDDKVLALAEPLIRFHIDGQRVRGLGSVSWEVTLLAGDARQKVTIDATARAWVNQVELVKPVAYHQTIRADDVAVKRSLVDRQSAETILKKEQIIGQWASQGLEAGTLLMPRHIEAVPLVKTGQFVTVIAEQGTVHVKSSAVAMEGGTFGQTIKLRNESTGETFQATVTGPQTARVSGPIPGSPGVASTND